MGPEIDEVSVGEDGIGFAELLIHQIHNQREVMLAAVAHVLYLRRLELRLSLLHTDLAPPLLLVVSAGHSNCVKAKRYAYPAKSGILLSHLKIF